MTGPTSLLTSSGPTLSATVGTVQSLEDSPASTETNAPGALPRLFELRVVNANAVPASSPAADFSLGPFDAHKEELKRKLAAGLMARNSQLRLAEFPFQHIAHFEGISLEDAHRKYRHVELNSSDGGHGIQIILGDDEASATIPFWHASDKSSAAFKEFWECLELICRETGRLICEPVSGRKYQPPEGAALLRDQYQALARQLREPAVLSEPLPQGGGSSGPEPSSPPKLNGEPPAPEIRLLPSPENSGAVWVAVRDNAAVCGFAKVSLSRASANGAGASARLTEWYVAPDFRGRGVGRRLLSAAEHWAASQGALQLMSELDCADTAGLRAYLRCGFAETHRTARLVKNLETNGDASCPVLKSPQGEIGRFNS